MGSKTFENTLERYRLALIGAINHPEIFKKLIKHGYDLKKLQEGKAWCEQLEMLSHTQNDGQGEQKNATAEFEKARKEINTIYHHHLDIAKYVLQNDRRLWDTLQLEGPRKTTIPGWLSQTKAFYSNVHRVAAQMDQRGVSLSELTQTKEMLEAAAELRIKQAYKMGDKQSATEQKQLLKQKLDAWMSDFYYIVKFALKDDKQMLESLGIVVPSGKKTKARRKKSVDK